MRQWTTVDRPVGEQFSYWREVICEAFTPLASQRTSRHRPAGPRTPGITSWVRSSMLTATNCAEVSSETQLIRHGDAEVRRTDSDQVFVNLQLAGHCVGVQDGRRCVVPAGGFALFDTTRTYDLDFVADPGSGEWRVVSFRVPRARLVPLLADPHGFTSVAHDAKNPGAANLVATTMMSIWRNVDGLDASSSDAAESAFTAVLAAGVGPDVGLVERRRDVLDAELRAAITRHVSANLATGDLSPQRVARRFGISVRKLHALYEGSPRTFAQTVTEMRVDACARELAAGTAGRTLTDIAARWGFCDLSHMNKVFRAHRGCLPSEYRARSVDQG
jgi:AraC-like DNA-binding protein